MIFILMVIFMVPLSETTARMLSVDIFLWTVTGRQEVASVLALIQTAVVIPGYIAARLIAGRALRQSML